MASGDNLGAIASQATSEKILETLVGARGGY